MQFNINNHLNHDYLYGAANTQPLNEVSYLVPSVCCNLFISLKITSISPYFKKKPHLSTNFEQTVVFAIYTRVSPKYYSASRRDGRVVECTGLENRHGFIAHLGFKSLSLHHILIGGFFISINTNGYALERCPSGRRSSPAKGV